MSRVTPSVLNRLSLPTRLLPNQLVKRHSCCGSCASAWGLLNAVVAAVTSAAAPPGGPLVSARFAGNLRLQKAAQNSPPLKIGEPKGQAVALVQQTLAEFGYALPVTFASGQADGIYGSETAAAVRKFQQDQKFPFSGCDSIAGRDTLTRMDALLVGSSGAGTALASMPTPGATPMMGQTPGERQEGVIAKAIANSKTTASLAALKLVQLDAHLATNPVFSTTTRAQFQPTLTALERWLKVIPGQPNFANNVNRAKELVQSNVAMVADVVSQESTGSDCQKGGFAWANVGRPDRGVRCCDAFFSSGPNCQRDVITHEFFHLLGANHGGDTRATQTTAEAFDSADDLAQMVSELFDTSSDACAVGK